MDARGRNSMSSAIPPSSGPGPSGPAPLPGGEAPAATPCLAPDASGRGPSLRGVLATACGNALEWYDFALYGYFAPILAGLFFPSTDRVASLLATFGVFAIGFAMRIVGGVVFGRLSDRVGRVRALQLSVVMMALPTTLMGLLPTHAQAGIAAPILLVLLRMLQGVSVGGEFATSMTMLVEHAPRDRRGRDGSWGEFAVIVGFLMGSGIGALVSASMSRAALLSWGWRLPFLLGAVIGVVGAYIRRNLADTAEFAALQRAQPPPALGEVLRRHGGQVLLVAGGSLLFLTGFYVPFVYLATFLDTETAISLAGALRISTGALVVIAVMAPVFGHLADRVGRRAVQIGGAAAMAVAAVPLFLLFERGDARLDLLGEVIFAVTFAAQGAVTPGLLVEMLPMRVRGTGFAVGYNVAAAVAGATPLLATYLIAVSGVKLAPSLLLIAVAVVSLLCYQRAARPDASA